MVISELKSIIILSGILIAFIVISFQRKQLITRLDAPTYKIASKVHNAGFDSYSAFIRAEAHAKELTEEGIRTYNQGNFTTATDHFETALDVFQRQENLLSIAENLYNLCSIQMDLGNFITE